jgi:hypothetical protein
MATKDIDAQVLLDPFEEQYHLPALLIDLRDGDCRQREVVGSRQDKSRLKQLPCNHLQAADAS